MRLICQASIKSDKDSKIAREEVEKIEDTVTEKVEEALGTSVEDLSNRLRSLRN